MVAGDEAAPEIQALVHGINAALGNAGSTVRYTEPVAVTSPDAAAQNGELASLRALVEDLNAGRVSFLVLLGTNPVYDAPADLGFEAAIQKAKTRVHVGQYTDETAEWCQWQIPEAHLLEAWGDARSLDGTVTIQQPLIEPLYGGKSLAEVVAGLNGDKSGAMDLVKATWTARGLDEAAWRKALHDGQIADTAAAPRTPVATAAAFSMPAVPEAAGKSLPILFRADPTLGDGRWANSGWLQECPKPLTKLTWDNALLVSPKTQEALGLAHERLAELRIAGRVLKVPVWVMPGHAEGCATLHLGHGRSKAGRVGDGVGTNSYRLRGSDGLWMAAAEVTNTGERYQLSSTQMHYNIFDGEGELAQKRHLIRTVPLAELARNPDAIQEMEHVPSKELSLYPEFEYKDYKWGMAIDLNACTGCNACVVACQSENNIPVVGKEQVEIGREMHWIRVDRYYAGDLDDPSVFHQPLTCMQCENAPCEHVCPVAATTHATEGLNDMVYNRCVGTRYCANNCPYKVRRFNYLYWNGDTYNDAQSHPVLELMQQPRRHGAQPRRDGEVHLLRAADQSDEDPDAQSRAARCGTARSRPPASRPARRTPSSFGNLNDAEAEVSRWKASKRNYGAARGTADAAAHDLPGAHHQPQPGSAVGHFGAGPAFRFARRLREAMKEADVLHASIRPPKPEFIEPGHTPGTVTDQISRGRHPQDAALVVHRLRHRLPAGADAVQRDRLPVRDRHRHLGQQRAGGLGVRHHQLRLVDRHRPRRHADLGDPAPAAAALAHLDQPLRRGDDDLRRGLRRHSSRCSTSAVRGSPTGSCRCPTRWACGRTSAAR